MYARRASVNVIGWISLLGYAALCGLMVLLA
jgi:hypothetical protein